MLNPIEKFKDAILHLNRDSLQCTVLCCPLPTSLPTQYCSVKAYLLYLYLNLLHVSSGCHPDTWLLKQIEIRLNSLLLSTKGIFFSPEQSQDFLSTMCYKFHDKISIKPHINYTCGCHPDTWLYVDWLNICPWFTLDFLIELGCMS